MRYINTLSIFLLVALMASCNSEKTPFGLKFTRHRTGDTVLVKNGQYLIMNMRVVDANDSVWHDTRAVDQPMIVRVAPPILPGLKEPGEVGVYRMLHKGDSVSFRVDARTIYEKTYNQELPKTLSPNLKVKYNIGVIEIVDEAGLEKYQLRNLERYEAIKLQNQVRQFGIDTLILRDYFNKNSIRGYRTLSGIRYTVTKEGVGPSPVSGDKVTVRYTGKFLDGTVFDSNVEKIDPIVVNLGKAEVIIGWEEVLLLVKKGGKYTFYIPSLYCYGDTGSGKRIPPNSILVFEMEITDIQKK